jgi:hypothetical protein
LRQNPHHEMRLFLRSREVLCPGTTFGVVG